MRELKLDVYSLYPGLTDLGPYDYAILVDEVAAGGFLCESYGVRITSRASGEHSEVANVTISASRIDELMDLLVRNQVSPIHLQDVVADWL